MFQTFEKNTKIGSPLNTSSIVPVTLLSYLDASHVHFLNPSSATAMLARTRASHPRMLFLDRRSHDRLCPNMPEEVRLASPESLCVRQTRAEQTLSISCACPISAAGLSSTSSHAIAHTTAVVAANTDSDKSVCFYISPWVHEQNAPTRE